MKSSHGTAAALLDLGILAKGVEEGKYRVSGTTHRTGRGV